MHTVDDPITWHPQRLTVAGVSGAGKTTLCDQLAGLLNYPRVEIDSLHHGPQWTPRPAFVQDVKDFIAGPRWVIELQYRQVRPLIAARADTLLWLDYPTPISMARLIDRTVRRRRRGEELWNGNYEPALHTFFTDKEHIIRWGWNTRNKLKPVIPTLESRFPGLHVVHLQHPRQTQCWVQQLREQRRLR